MRLKKNPKRKAAGVAVNDDKVLGLIIFSTGWTIEYIRKLEPDVVLRLYSVFSELHQQKLPLSLHGDKNIGNTKRYSSKASDVREFAQIMQKP